MKRFFLLIGFILVFSTSMATAQEEMKGSGKDMMGKDGMSAEQQAMMAKWKEYATPNKNHQVLNDLVGDWTYTLTHKMSADAPAEESTGRSVSAWIMNGRFVEEKVTGTSMGQPFEGVSILGYNNGSKKYSSYWYDNMSTGSMFSEGVYDENAMTISSGGTFFCPMRDGDTIYRSVLTITDGNNHIYEMYMTENDGSEFLAMKISYTKVQ